MHMGVAVFHLKYQDPIELIERYNELSFFPEGVDIPEEDVDNDPRFNLPHFDYFTVWDDLYKIRVRDAFISNDFYTYLVISPSGRWYCGYGMDWYLGRKSPIEWKQNFKHRFLDVAAARDWYLTVMDWHV